MPEPMEIMSRLAFITFLVGVVFTLYIGILWTYNIFFHPLSGYPGPWLYAASRIPHCYHLLNGDHHKSVYRLHNRYGPVVRIAPDELAYADSRAWRDIQGHKNNATEFPKNRIQYRAGRSRWLPNNILFSGRDEHAALRRQLSHGFSDKSMREQEPIIASFVDLLIQRLHERCDDGKTALRMDSWYNFTTFDIIGELAFGETFGCLEQSGYHPWVKCLFDLARLGCYFQVEDHYPITQRLITRVVPNQALEKQQMHDELNKAKIEKRIEQGSRNDLIEGLLKKREEWNMPIDRIESNSSLLVIAGSETTATLLAGATYLLTSTPHTLARLNEEVRSAFSSDAEINIETAGKLPYMLACLEEALRMYPPVPVALPRVTPEEGAQVAGQFVPKGTTVGLHHYAVYHLERNFKDPFNFHPERFLGDPRFADDDRLAFQPFHVGPRNCIGRNLAYAEMRLILARIVFNFDMALADESRGWLKNQRVFNFWEKPPLHVYLKPRVAAKTVPS